MANPQPTALSWEDIQTMLANMGVTGTDPTLLTQFINDSRTAIEAEREWQVLKKYDTSLQWLTSDTFQTAHAIPAGFGRWCEENPIQVWDGNTTNPTVLPITIIPYDEQLWNYSTQYTAAVDYSTMNLYFMGTAGQTWTVVLSYIQENGDIVQKSSNGNVATQWVGFPARFHRYLPLDVASRIRLGVSYDDLAARNADDNAVAAARIKQSMQKWDAGLIRTQLKNRDYLPEGSTMFISRRINITP